MEKKNKMFHIVTCNKPLPKDALIYIYLTDGSEIIQNSDPLLLGAKGNENECRPSAPIMQLDMTESDVSYKILVYYRY